MGVVSAKEGNGGDAIVEEVVEKSAYARSTRYVLRCRFLLCLAQTAEPRIEEVNGRGSAQQSFIYYGKSKTDNDHLAI